MAWTGHVLVTPGGSPAGAALDPGTPHWLDLPPSPLGLADGASAVWTGRQLLVWGGFGATGRGSSTGALLTPRATPQHPPDEQAASRQGPSERYSRSSTATLTGHPIRLAGRLPGDQRVRERAGSPRRGRPPWYFWDLALVQRRCPRSRPVMGGSGKRRPFRPLPKGEPHQSLPRSRRNGRCRGPGSAALGCPGHRCGPYRPALRWVSPSLPADGLMIQAGRRRAPNALPRAGCVPGCRGMRSAHRTRGRGEAFNVVPPSCVCRAGRAPVFRPSGAERGRSRDRRSRCRPGPSRLATSPAQMRNRGVSRGVVLA